MRERYYDVPIDAIKASQISRVRDSRKHRGHIFTDDTEGSKRIRGRMSFSVKEAMSSWSLIWLPSENHQINLLDSNSLVS